MGVVLIIKFASFYCVYSEELVIDRLSWMVSHEFYIFEIAYWRRSRRMDFWDLLGWDERGGIRGGG
jgi:hypothetical protein